MMFSIEIFNAEKQTRSKGINLGGGMRLSILSSCKAFGLLVFILGSKTAFSMGHVHNTCSYVCLEPSNMNTDLTFRLKNRLSKENKGHPRARRSLTSSIPGVLTNKALVHTYPSKSIKKTWSNYCKQF